MQQSQKGTAFELTDAAGMTGPDVPLKRESALGASAGYQPLQQELELYRRALNAIPGHFIILDARSAGTPIVFANTATARDYGHAPTAMPGLKFSTLADFGASEDQQGEWLRHAVAAGPAARTELQAIRRDGSKFIAGMAFSALTDDHGQITHLVCSGRDITAIVEEQRKRRDLQEQLYTEMRERERIAIELRLAQKLESVGRLAAGIAHEINTPIQYVGDSLHFLKSAMADLHQLNQAYRAALDAFKTAVPNDAASANLHRIEANIDTAFLDAEIPEAFERMHEGVERVASIVRAMKEFAHPDAQEQSPADINHAIETTLLVAKNEYKYIAAVETSLSELPAVVCNVNELNQVFLNLIVNAAHAIEAGGRDVSTGRIKISTAALSDSVEIMFEDNGCGIPKDNLERIFDPFFTTKEVGKGTGQGLAIARSIIVEKHGGTIVVESQLGQGTRMIMRLPKAGRQTDSIA